MPGARWPTGRFSTRINPVEGQDEAEQPDADSRYGSDSIVPGSSHDRSFLSVRLNKFVHSETCSGCGARFEHLTLWDRRVECGCGVSLDRDHNPGVLGRLSSSKGAGMSPWASSLAMAGFARKLPQFKWGQSVHDRYLCCVPLAKVVRGKVKYSGTGSLGEQGVLRGSSRESMRMTILDEIVASKRHEVAAARRRMPLEELEAQAAEAPPVRDFRAALAGPGPIQLIAEVKKASPSAKVIRADFDPVAIARTYQEHGAACISVLTDAPYFQGHLSYLARVRASVAIPLLRKDFLIDEYQVVEARLAGADAILLIAEILDDETMATLLERARALGMAALVELHDPANLPRVLAAGADLVGINNRDLRHFATDIEHTLRLRDQVPPEVVLVSESGIRTRADVERLEAAGVSAILVGESLMRAADIGLAVERLLGLAPEAHRRPA